MAGTPRRRAKREAQARAAQEAAAVAVVAGLPAPSPDGQAPSVRAQSHTEAHQRAFASPKAITHATPQTPASEAPSGLKLDTGEYSQLVFDLSCAGIPAERIAKYIGVSVDTLRTEYARELDVAVDEAARLAHLGLLTKARLGDVQAATAILKAHVPEVWDRAKSTKVEMSGKVELDVNIKAALIDRILQVLPAPQAVEVKVAPPLKKLS